MTTHELKTDPIPFTAVLEGRKTFELRRDDRGFADGDRLRLRETEHPGRHMAEGAPLVYTGRELVVRVKHIVHGPIYGLPARWVVMSIGPDYCDTCQGSGDVPFEVLRGPHTVDAGLRNCDDCTGTGVIPEPVDRLRTAAAALNKALVSCDMEEAPASLVRAVTAWRRAWLQVDGRELPVGNVAVAPAPIRNAHSFERGGR